MGFRKDPRLGTRYVEIPLDYSVIMHEPIITQNISDDEISRLLVGRVYDPDLGNLEAKAIFNFSPPIEPVFPTENAEFVSLKLVVKFDFYSYGATDSSDLQLTVHELDEQLTPERLYYSGTSISYNSTPVGDTIFALGPAELRDGWQKASDNDPANNAYYVLPIRIDGPIGPSLLNDLVNDRITIDDFTLFSQRYRGFALTMPVGNKILGFTPVYALPTPTSTDSRLVLTYKESGTTQVVDFPIYYAAVNNILNPVVSYTLLEPDRSGSVIDGLQSFTDLVPTDGKLYTQSGTGIMPKFDLTKFYQYFDTVDFPIINSAELVLDNAYTGRTPQTFELLLLNSTNKFRPFLIGENPDPYLARIRPGIVPFAQGNETRVAILNELTGGNINIDQETGKVGLTIMTEFFQQIVDYKSDTGRARAFALHPVQNEFNKTVSVLKLNSSSARLRVYYSKPLTSLP
ncbi:MAG: DUF4270 family protein [Cyclobacteriaceae bacterium]|nr:DUF4270 family protein [Cyclobacteriaceae bacterium]